MKRLHRLNRPFQKDKTPFRPTVSSIKATPKGQGATKGYKVPVRKWDARCSVCEGHREVRGLSGWLPCPRCVPTTQEQARQQEAEHQERVRGVSQ